MGPTAAGKTALALRLCERFPFEIISVDSSQVYRGMDIGTAKPSAEERARAPHRLLDIRDPTETYSAAQFREDALREMAEITRRHRIPLLVGGTMFYFRVLERGLSPLPSADAEIRATLRAEGEKLGWPILHARLADIDPETAVRIDPHDAQRIQRALEIHTITGKPPSILNRHSRTGKIPYTLIKIAIAPADRTELHRRIEARFHTMLEAGLVEEVAGLYARPDLSAETPSMRIVGYRQVWQYLIKAIKYSQINNLGIYATRQLAKRQLTWLRSEDGITWFDSAQAGYERAVDDFFTDLFLNMGIYYSDICL